MTLYKFGRFVVNAFFKVFFRVKFVGKENIPSVDERFIICANHKSNLDPPLVGTAFSFEIGFMAKEELFKNKIFGKLITALGAFPIKRGKSDFGALRTAISLVADGKHKDRLRKGKMGAALVAVKARANILPIGIEGEYKPFGKLIVRIGKPIELTSYFDEKLNSAELQEITDKLLMPKISELSNIPLNNQI